MKDMYTFDSNLENAQKTYDIVYETYCKIFKKLGLNYFPVEGSVGMMGGTASHEFQVPSAAGENDILTCTSCKSGYSVELIEEREKNFDGHCKSCGGQLEKANGIEV